jgi:hypothetical protein
MCVTEGTGSTLRIKTPAKLEVRRSDVSTMYVLPMEKHKLEFSNEYMYNVLQCIVVELYSSHSYPRPLDIS